MNNPPSFEHAKTYLDTQIFQTRTTAAGAIRSEGPFITISRECGAGASTLAHTLALGLNEERGPQSQLWSIFDKELVEQTLQLQHLSPELARFLPEDRISLLDASVGELVGLHPNVWTLVQTANEFMRDLASRGHAILIGRGSNFATASVRNAVHVRLVAPPADRARRTAALQGLTIEEAFAYNKRTDAARRHYVSSVFDADVADPTAYHLVINTSVVAIDEAAALITDAIRLRERVERS